MPTITGADSIKSAMLTNNVAYCGGAAIGFTGYNGAGKSTVAEHVAKAMQCDVFSFATPLREMVREINPVVGAHGGEVYRWSEVVDRHGYYLAKQMFPEVRQALISHGEYFRLRDEMYWVDKMQLSLPEGGHVVIDDVRFPAEAEMCDVVIAVVKDGYPTEGTIVPAAGMVTYFPQYGETAEDAAAMLMQDVLMEVK